MHLNSRLTVKAYGYKWNQNNMEETEVLIIGQGLSGSWLSYWLHKAAISLRVIDQPNPDGASRRAAGLINPVTGRRMVTTWMIDELMPFARSAYGEFGSFLDQRLIEDVSVIDFFPSVQMLQAFQKRFDEDPAYLRPEENREKYATWFQYELGWGAISPCLLVDVVKLLAAWRDWLSKNNLLTESDFDNLKLRIHDGGIEYSDIQARYIIFCDGKSSALNPYFDKLPFALNKGEGMLVEIKGLPQHAVFKKGMSLVPYRENIFWLGSSYGWSFENDQPTESFRSQAENWLNHFLKLPYRILEHFASIRPATLERKPFVGFHPTYPQIGILNGLGTKGCSLAPYFARQLADYLRDGKEINPLADIKRFGKILARQS
jgi:glycine/D-amino acid oxidase-like deaminating enzyme